MLVAYPDIADERHVFALYDLQVHGGGRDLWHAGKLWLWEICDGGSVESLGAETSGLDGMGDGEVFQPTLQLVQTTVAVPRVAVERQIPTVR